MKQLYFLRQLQVNIFKRKFSQDIIRPVTVDFVNGIKTITMNEEKTRNALSIEMMQNLIDNIEEHKEDTALRVIVIAAVGHVFSAGHNLKELSSSMGKSNHQKVFEFASQLMYAIVNSPVPIIAKVNGVAAAAGCQLVAQCDLAICSDHSIFSTPGVNFGIFCSTPGVALSRSVPKSTAMKMLLTGKPIMAEEAENSGLVAATCKEKDLDDTVKNFCEDIITKSREVIELGKKFYYEQINLPIEEAYRNGEHIMVENLQLPDGREGIKSFIEKRKATWSHGMK